MEYLIMVILAAAWLQSGVKLTLLPRFPRWTLLVLAVLPLFFLQRETAGLNLQTLDRFLKNGDHLKDLCGLVVIQELTVLLVGFALIREIELGKKRHLWKYVALLPSLLLPAGALYLQTLAFNWFPRRNFTLLTCLTAGGLLLAGILFCEVFALIRRDRLKKLSSAVNATWLLLLLAIFLPVAAEREFSGMDLGGISLRDLLPLPLLAVIVAISFAGCYVIRKYLENKKYHESDR